MLKFMCRLAKVVSLFALCAMLELITPFKATATDLGWKAVAASTMDWSHDGKRIAIGYETGSVDVIDAVSKVVIRSIGLPNWAVVSVAWNPQNNDELALSTISENSFTRIQILNVGTGMIDKIIDVNNAGFTTLAWRPDGVSLAVIAQYGLEPDATYGIDLFNASTGKWLNTIAQDNQSFRAFDWSPDGKRIVSTTSENYVQISRDFDQTEDYATQIELKGHSDAINAVDWKPDGTQIASGSWDGTLRIWDIESQSEIKQFSYEDNAIFAVRWNPMLNQIALHVGSELLIIQEETGHILETISVPNENSVVNVSAWSPDGTQLAYVISNSKDKSGRLEIIPAPKATITESLPKTG